MLNRAFLAIPLISLSTSLAFPSAASEKAIWARDAVASDARCAKSTPKPQTIVAPDGNSKVELLCDGFDKDGDVIVHLRVTTPDGQKLNTVLDEGAHEILWAPNSMAFLVNGGFSAIAGFFTTAYLISPDGVRKIDFTEAAQLDMVESFPPCKAWNRDANDCISTSKNPEFNMSGVSWLPDSSGVAVFAEVPCSSRYGGIMCQVLGYELKVPEGTILRRMTAKEFKHKWGSYAAWHIRIPDPPEYGPANVTFPPSPGTRTKPNASNP